MLPYSVSVPTFGVWGFALASVEKTVSQPTELLPLTGDLKFLTNEIMTNMFDLPRDFQRIDTELNQLNNQILVRYYDQEWSGRE